MINPFYSTRVVMVVIVLLTILLEQTIFNTSNLVYPHIVGIEAIYLKKRRIALLWGIVTSLIYRWIMFVALCHSYGTNLRESSTRQSTTRKYSP